MRRTSQRVTLLMLVLASITIITLDYHGEASRAITHIRNAARDVLSPTQRAIAATLHPIGDIFTGAVHYGSLQEQNARLRNQIGQLESELAQNTNSEAVANRIVALSHLSYDSNLATIAEIISAPTSNFQSTIELKQGRDAGVGPGEPVVANGGLIGSVISSSASTSTVQLVSDAASKIAVQVGTDGLDWIATGGGPGQMLKLSFTGNGSPVSAHVGQLVTTSGLDEGAYPAGIPIATVRSVSTSDDGLIESVSAQPIVDLNNVQYVDVLIWMAPA